MLQLLVMIYFADHGTTYATEEVVSQNVQNDYIVPIVLVSAAIIVILVSVIAKNIARSKRA